MEQLEDFVVVDEEPVNSPSQAMQSLCILINTFTRSIDATQQSIVLLKDQLRLALDVTLQNIKPEHSTDFNDLFDAFESKLTNSDDIRQNYIKHILSRLVSANTQNQAFQRELEDQKIASEARIHTLSVKLQQAMSSLNVIQSTLGIIQPSSIDDGDFTPHVPACETTGHQLHVNQSGGDKEDGQTTTNDSSRSGDDEILSVLTDLCDRLSAVQLRLTHRNAEAADTNPNAARRSSVGQAQSEPCIETSSFVTVDEPVSRQLCSATYENTAPGRPDGHAAADLTASPSSPGGDAWRRQGTASQATLRDVVSQCYSADPARHAGAEESSMTNSPPLEAACQWMDTQPTRLIPGNQPIIPQASSSNSTDTLPVANEPVVAQASTSTSVAKPTETGVAENRPQHAAKNKTVGDSVVEGLLHVSKPRTLTPTFSADQETPWCPCCQHRFGSRVELEAHLLSQESHQC